MYLAAQNGHVAVVRLLCEARGNIDQPKTDGATPILIAAQAGRAAFVQLQCDAGANTPVSHHECATPIFIAALHGHALVRPMSGARVDKDQPKTNGGIPMYTAVSAGNEAVVLTQFFSYGWCARRLCSYSATLAPPRTLTSLMVQLQYSLQLRRETRRLRGCCVRLAPTRSDYD